MQKLLFKTFICLAGAGIALYAAVREQNSLMDLRRSVPPLAKEVKALQEENQRLKYLVDRFENPVHLMELAREPQYGHLRYPYTQDVMIVPKEHE
jgi:Cys-tRNA synthase (O-phospho-L-seryl-tRNA:Cys-tRNA synthase)